MLDSRHPHRPEEAQKHAINPTAPLLARLPTGSYLQSIATCAQAPLRIQQTELCTLTGMASGGMAELRAAEQKAAQVVQEARAARGERLKEANSEAKGVIDNYRNDKERQLQEVIKSRYGSSGSQSADLDRQTEEELKRLKSEFDRSKDNVLNLLVDKVINVHITVPDAWGITTKH